jgi:hypothetical protein
MTALLKRGELGCSYFVFGELKADCKVMVTDAEAVADSIRRAKIGVNTSMFYFKCQVHNDSETDSSMQFLYMSKIFLSNACRRICRM